MQYLVRVGMGKDRERALSWLEAHGYKVSGCLQDGSYPYSVVVVGDGIVAGGNVTFFAIMTSRGEKVMSWEEWKEEKRNGNLFC